MKNKDQILLEQAYSKVINEMFDDDFDSYPAWMHRLARQKGVPVWRIAEYGDDEEENQNPTPKFKERQEGEEFFSKKHGKNFIMIKDKDGKLMPTSKVFSGKDGRQWERVKKKDGSWAIKPYTSSPVKDSYDEEDDHNRDDDSDTFYREDTVMFNDPHKLPYCYEVSYEKKMESGFYDDSVVGVEINWAKAYKKDSEETEFLFDITNETNPTLSDIQDWVYNWAIGDSELDIL
jgi:hypothetical protein